MPPVSKYNPNSKVLDRLFTLFFETVGKINNRDEFDKILFDILSPVERLMIAKRIAIYYLLMKKKDYISISNSLKVSPATIAKFRMLLDRSEGIVPHMNKILRNEKIVEFLEEVFQELYRPGSYGTNWSAAWQRKIAFENKKSKGI